MSPPITPVRNWTKAGIVFATVAGLTGLISYASITRSLDVGRLSAYPQYDDVGYFGSALDWLTHAHGRSLWTNLYILLDQHATVSTLTAAAGFLLTPESYIGHYAINAVFVGAFFSVVACFLRHRPTLDIVLCLVVLACFPLFVQVMTEARPDLPLGLMLSLCLAWILWGRLAERSNIALLIGGLLSGFAVTIKPSALPASLFFVLFTVAVALVPDWRRAVRTFTLFAVGLLIGIAPLVEIRIGAIIDYLIIGFVTYADLLKSQFTTLQHATYFSVGGGGQLAFGIALFWFGCALFAVRLWIGIAVDRRELRPVLSLLAVLLCLYLVPTIVASKSFFFGAIFYSLFAIALVLNLAAVLAHLDTRFGRTRPLMAAKIAALLLALIAFCVNIVLGRVPLATQFNPELARLTNAGADLIWSVVQQAVAKRATAERPVLVMFNAPHPVNPPTIALRAMRARLPVNTDATFFNRTIEEQISQLTAGDLIVVTSTLPNQLPGGLMGSEIIRTLDGRPDICLIDVLPMNEDGAMRIYGNRKSAAIGAALANDAATGRCKL